LVWAEPGRGRDIRDLLDHQPWLDGDATVTVTSTMRPDRPTPPWPSGPSVITIPDDEQPARP
jgi:hypothetical protein